jgi:hypothetical protein
LLKVDAYLIGMATDAANRIADFILKQDVQENNDSEPINEHHTKTSEARNEFSPRLFRLIPEYALGASPSS